MPDEGLDDGSGKEKRPKLLWNRFKWMIFVANTVVRPSLSLSFRSFRRLEAHSSFSRTCSSSSTRS